MRALIIPAAVLAAVLAFALWSGCYIQNQAEAWTALLGEADQAAGEERWEETEQRLQQSYDSWQKSRTFLHTVVEHDDLDEVETLFAAAFAACDEEDIPDFHTALNQLSEKLNLLAETQEISVKNIL